ncbi:MAG: D-aminoacylase [Planctomycetota bacterium]
MQRFFAVAVLCISAIGSAVCADEPIDADLLLAGGTLHLGDGEEAKVGDVAIVGDKIVAVGEFELGKFKKRINCEGFIVSPGFIDLHSHSDRSSLKKETRLIGNYLTQGCTTVLTGNCGAGHVDVAEYYDKLDQNGVGLNIAHLLPQGALRERVMQKERRDATAEELAEMKELADKAMREGAWGMSTGLIYVPSSYADTEEIIEIAKVIGAHDGIYASHIRGEGTGLLDSVKEAMQIGREADLPVHISHFKSSGKNSWGLVRIAIDLIEKERKAGQVVTADQYPYIASSTSLAATMLPAWARAGGSKKMLQRLAGGEDQERVHAAIRKKLELTDQGQRIQIARFRPNPAWAGKRIKEIADALRITPFATVLRILRSDSSTQIVNFGINEDDVRYVMQRDWVATASDGSAKIPNGDVPHPRNYGTFPRKIGYYCIREKVLELPSAIRSATGLPADIMGLSDRGYLRAGYAADVAVWKENELIDKATFEKPDRYSEGIRLLLVNGVPAIWDSQLTGKLAGRALRRPVPKSN